MKTNVERMYLESLENAMGQFKFPEAQTQINKVTGRSYRRLNQLILIAKQRELNSKSNQWVSKEQLEELQEANCQSRLQITHCYQKPCYHYLKNSTVLLTLRLVTDKDISI